MLGGGISLDHHNCCFNSAVINSLPGLFSTIGSVLLTSRDCEVLLIVQYQLIIKWRGFLYYFQPLLIIYEVCYGIYCSWLQESK